MHDVVMTSAAGNNAAMWTKKLRLHFSNEDTALAQKIHVS